MPLKSVRVLSALSCTLAIAFLPQSGFAQHSHGSSATTVAMSSEDMAAMAAHMELTPLRAATKADWNRANAITDELRSAIEKYRDVRVAIADGFRVFAPNVKNQRVYHFTRNLWALENQFRFNPAKPTSLLYTKDENGNFVLLGAMYSAPKRYTAAALDDRIPTSIARWHKHINWCLPPRRAPVERWADMNNGRPVFGPLGVSTREACNAAGGRFVKEVFGWMVHVNVFADDPKDIWADTQMRGDEMISP